MFEIIFMNGRYLVVYCSRINKEDRFVLYEKKSLPCENKPRIYGALQLPTIALFLAGELLGQVTTSSFRNVVKSLPVQRHFLILLKVLLVH